MDAPTPHVHNDHNPHIVTPSVDVKGGGWLETPKPRYTQDAAEKIKAQLPLEDVVGETVALKPAGQSRLKGLCPFHNEKTSSFVVSTDKGLYRCFGCGASGDLFTFVMATQGLEFKAALEQLVQRVGGSYLTTAAPRVSARPERVKSAFTVVEAGTLELHRRRAAQLTKGPKALSGRGFTVSDLRRLGIAASGDDAIIPITGPTGAVFALKRRYAEVCGTTRYIYDTPGHGTPAWCSPGFLEAVEILIIEGELNGMACYLARPDLGVMGVAGTNGAIYPDPLEGKTVYVYGDGDKVGLEARARWAQEATDAGAAKVYLLEPWDMDACDVAGKLGRNELTGRLS